MSNNLFGLIKSMSKSEKRYFKIFATQHSGKKDNISVRLFDIIHDQEHYNDELIKESFEGERAQNQLHVAKNYLYRLVLKSLMLYYAENTAWQEIKELQVKMRILKQKSLYKQVFELLRKAKALALRYHFQDLVLELLDFELQMHELQSYQGFEKEDWDKLFEEKEYVQTVIRRRGNYQKIYSEISWLFRKYGHRVNKELGDMRLRIEQLETDLEIADLWFEEKGMLLNALIALYTINYNKNKRLNFCLQYDKLWQQNPHQLEEKLEDYALNLHRLLNAQIDCKRFQDYENTLERFAQIPTIFEKKCTTHLQQLIQARVAFLQIYYFINTGKIREGVLFVEQIQANHNFKIEHQLEQSYVMAYLYFANGDYHKTIDLINRLFLIAGPHLRYDLRAFAQLLMLIAHFEIGNLDIIDYLISSLYRYMLKRKILFNYEKAILQFFKKLKNNPSSSQISLLFKELHNELKNIFQEEEESILLQYFDILSWLESKIEQKPFAEILAKKSLYL